MSEQDRFLPVANISRIMRKVLPENKGKISKEAKDMVQECVSEYISFITSEASDKCQGEKRRTIGGDDIMWALSALGFDKYIDPLRVFVQKFRETSKQKATPASHHPVEPPRNVARSALAMDPLRPTGTSFGRTAVSAPPTAWSIGSPAKSLAKTRSRR